MTTLDEPLPGADLGTRARWTLGPRFMLRVSGLPVEAGARLSFPRTARWLDRVLASEQRLRDAALRVGDLLHNAVATSAEDKIRRELINLRRRVHNDRPIADAQRVRELIARSCPDGVEAFDGWLGERDNRERLLGFGLAILDNEQTQVRSAIRELARDPRLRNGLLLASPSLDTYLDSYLDAPSDQKSAELSKRHRRIERSLLEYLYRVIYKTSPFSTFTSVALGEFREDPGTSIAEVTEGTSSYVRINMSILRLLAELIMDNDELRGELPIELTSGWQVDAGRIRYVRRSVQSGDTGSTVAFDSVRDSLFTLHNTAPLGCILAVFAATPSLRWADLVGQLCAIGGGEPADWNGYVRVLLRLGLLRVPVLQVDIYEPDPLRHFTQAVRSSGCRLAGCVGDDLDQIISCLDAYPAASTDERRRLVNGVRGALEHLVARLGQPDHPLPVTLLFEDTRLAGPPVMVDHERWLRGIGTHLRSLERILPAFELDLPRRLVLKGFFLARYGRGGRCDDLLKLVCDFNEDIFEQYLAASSARRAFNEDNRYVPHVNWLRQPELVVLDRARLEFARRIREIAWDAGTEEIVLDEQMVDAVAAELVPLRSNFLPRCHFVQVSRLDGDGLAVLNHSYGGPLYPFTRFTHCFDGERGAHTEELACWLRGVQPPGVVFAELTGGYAATNLNLHGRMTEYEIVCPGESTTTRPRRQIPLDDLYMEHDPVADRLCLRSRGLGLEVFPAYLGYLVPDALSDVPRTLILLSQATNVVFDPWGGIPQCQIGQVSYRPRVRYGPVVISHRSWSVPAGALPKRRTGAAATEWLLDWRRWRQAHTVPATVFATVRNPNGAQDGTNAVSPHVKPQYVDLGSCLSLMVFDSLIRSDGAEVVFREALPAPETLDVRAGTGHRVVELAIETYTHSAGH